MMYKKSKGTYWKGKVFQLFTVQLVDYCTDRLIQLMDGHTNLQFLTVSETMKRISNDIQMCSALQLTQRNQCQFEDTFKNLTIYSIAGLVWWDKVHQVTLFKEQVDIWVRLESGTSLITLKTRYFSKGTVLCGGYWLWARQMFGGLQTCITERLKVPNG